MYVAVAFPMNPVVKQAAYRGATLGISSAILGSSFNAVVAAYDVRTQTCFDQLLLRYGVGRRLVVRNIRSAGHGMYVTSQRADALRATKRATRRPCCCSRDSTLCRAKNVQAPPGSQQKRNVQKLRHSDRFLWYVLPRKIQNIQLYLVLEPKVERFCPIIVFE